MARKPKKAQSAEADLTPTDEAVHTAPLEITPTTTEDNNTVHHETFETPAIPTQTLASPNPHSQPRPWSSLA